MDKQAIAKAWVVRPWEDDDGLWTAEEHCATLRDALRETARALVGVARDPHSTRLGTQTIAAMAKVLAALPEEVTRE